MAEYVSEDLVLGTARAPGQVMRPAAGQQFVDEADVTGVAPKASLLENVQAHLYRQHALSYAQGRGESPRYGRDHGMPLPQEYTPLQRLGSESQAAANMMYGLPGGVASVGMDVLSRVSSLMHGQDSVTAGKMARSVADRVNQDWRKITDGLGLTGDAPGSKIEHLMNWAMEASDAGGEKLEKATNGVLTLETTQSVRDTLLNALGAQGIRVTGRKAITAKVAYSGKPAASVEAAVAQSKKRIHDAQVEKSIRDQSLMADPDLPAGATSWRWTPEEPLLPEQATKTEIKEHKNLVKEREQALSSIVMDKTKLAAAFRLAKNSGPEAEAALVQNIFDRVLAPQKKTAAREPSPFDQPIAEFDRLAKEAEGLQDGLGNVEARLRALQERGLAKLREKRPVTQEEASAIRELKPASTEGKIIGADGKPIIQRGRADPGLLGALAIMGLGAVAAKQVADWFNTGELSGDNARDIALGAGAAALGVASLGRGPVGRAAQRGWIKEKGGAWHENTVKNLSNAVKGRGLAREYLEPGLDELVAPATKSLHAWIPNAVKTWLNKHAGTKTDPLKDVMIQTPEGMKRWEDVTDQYFSSWPADSSFYKGKIGKGNEAIWAGKDIHARAAWDAQDARDVGDAMDARAAGYAQDARAAWDAMDALQTHLSHVGDYLRGLNLPPEKLAQYDLVRAVKETALADERAKAAALKEAMKEDLTRKADSDALPTVMEFPEVESGPRDFAFNKAQDGSIKQMDKVTLPAGKVKYAWKELALQEELTPEQAKRVASANDLHPEGSRHFGDNFVALDAAGKPIRDKFNHDTPATGKTPQEAHLAGVAAREGNALGHCVGQYCGQILRGNSKILSLRDQDGRSWATIEEKPSMQPERPGSLRAKLYTHHLPSIAQIKGPGNGPVPESARQYVKEFLNSKPLELTDEGRGDLERSGLKDGGNFVARGVIKGQRYLTNKEYLDARIADLEARIARPGPQGVDLEAGGIPIADSLFRLKMDRKELGGAKPEQLALLAAGTAMGAYALSNPENAQNIALGIGGAIALKKGAGESALIETFRKGGKEGEAAFAQIYTDNIGRLKRSIPQMGKDLPADDIAQDVMRKLAVSLQRPPEHPAFFRGEASLATVMHTAAQRLVNNNFRTAKARPDTESLTKFDAETAIGEEIQRDLPDATKAPEQVIATTELAKAMSSAMDKIRPEFRQAFELSELDGLSDQAIADQLNIPIGTVKSRISRAQKALQERLKEFDPRVKQQGKIDTELMVGAGIVSGGALFGAYLNEDNPVAGVLQGATAGFAAAVVARQRAGIDHLLGWTSMRLANLNSELRLAGRKMEMRRAQAVAQASTVLDNYTKAVKNLPAAAREQLRAAWMFGDRGQVTSIARSTPELNTAYAAVRKLQDTIGAKLVGFGRFQHHTADNFARVVKDWEGLMDAMGKEASTGVDALIAKANIKSLSKAGRELNEVERSDILNNYLSRDPETSSLPGFARARAVKMTPELMKFYYPMEDGLVLRAHQWTEDIAKAEFFGRDLVTVKEKGRGYTNVKASAGALADRLQQEGKLDAAGAKKLRELLRARFGGGERSPVEILQTVRNLTSIGLLGQFTSGLVQTSEIIMANYHHNVVDAVQGVALTAIGRGIKPSEFGLANHVIEEVINKSTSGKALSLVLKANLLTAFDQMGIGTNLTASYLKNKALVKYSGGRGLPNWRGGIESLKEKWGPDFGPDFPQLVKDLQESSIHKRSELVDLLIWSEISDIRPASRMEASEFHNANPNLRMAGHLKQFMLSQANVVRRDFYNKVKTGDPRQIAIGIKNLAIYATIMSLSLIPADAIKEWISGRDFDLRKIDFIDNFVRNFGLGRYTTDKIMQSKHPGKAAVEAVENFAKPPVLSVAERLGKGWTEPAELVPFIPLAGRPLYDRQFDGNEKREIQETRASNRDKLLTQRKPLSPAAQAWLRKQREEAKRVKQ